MLEREDKKCVQNVSEETIMKQLLGKRRNMKMNMTEVRCLSSHCTLTT